MTQTNTAQNKEELKKYKLGEFVFTRNSLGHFTTPEITGYFYEKKREIEFSEEQLIKMGAEQQIDKQELEQWEKEFDKYYSDLYYTKQCNSYMNGNTLCNYKYSKVYGIKNFISKLLSQAHQSGIEERDRAIYGILAVIENQLQDTSFGENPTEIVETVLTVIRQEMKKPHEQLLKELDEAPDV